MKNKINPEIATLAAIDWSMCATAGIIDGVAADMICKVIDLAKLPKILKPIVWLGTMSFGIWQAIKCFDISKEIVDFGKIVINHSKNEWDKCLDYCKNDVEANIEAYYRFKRDVDAAFETYKNLYKNSLNNDRHYDGDRDNSDNNADEEEDTIKGQIGFRI